MAETHTEFYKADAFHVVRYEVVGHPSPKTWTVRREWACGMAAPPRRVTAKQIGVEFFITPAAALTAVKAKYEREIEFLRYRLQVKRTALGQIESELRALGFPLSADAVDPSAADPGKPTTRE